jgi:hypothetical protein
MKRKNSGWHLTFKRRGWCWFHHSNEAGMRVVQIGPLVLELWNHQPTEFLVVGE